MEIPTKNAQAARDILRCHMIRTGFRAAREPDGRLRFDKGQFGWFGVPLIYGALFLLIAGVLLNVAFGFAGSVRGISGTRLPLRGGTTVCISEIRRGSTLGKDASDGHTELQIFNSSEEVIGTGFIHKDQSISLCGVDFSNASCHQVPGSVTNARNGIPVIVTAKYSHVPGNPLIYSALAIALVGVVLSSISRCRIWCQTFSSSVHISWERTASPSPQELACIYALLAEAPDTAFHRADCVSFESFLTVANKAERGAGVSATDC